MSGASPPKPVSSFGHFGFDDLLIKSIRRSEFAQPTPIQAQAIPALLSGRDCIGKGNKNVFSYHQIALRSIFKNLVKRQQNLKISSNGNKIKNLVKLQQDFSKSRQMATRF